MEKGQNVVAEDRRGGKRETEMKNTRDKQREMSAVHPDPAIPPSNAHLPTPDEIQL